MREEELTDLWRGKIGGSPLETLARALPPVFAAILAPSSRVQMNSDTKGELDAMTLRQFGAYKMKRAIKASNVTELHSTAFVPLFPTISQGICCQCRHRAATALRSTPSATYQLSNRRHYASESFASRLSKKLLGRTSKDVPTEPSEVPAQDPQSAREEEQPTGERDLFEDETDPNYVQASHARGLPRSSTLLAKAPGGPSGIRYQK